MRAVEVLEGARPDRLPAEALSPVGPLLLRGLVREWPAVAPSARSVDLGLAYLRRFCVDATVNAVRVPARHGGRVFYDGNLAGFNFEGMRLMRDAVLDGLKALADEGEARPALLGHREPSQGVAGLDR